jgi:hypothetical protein
MRVRKVELRSFTGKVYDLEVEPQHSYYANGIRVHNCHCRIQFDTEELLDRAESGELFRFFDGRDEIEVEV